MTTTCLIQDIQSVEIAAQKTVDSYESMVNDLLDKIIEYRRMLEDLTREMTELNQKIENQVCGQVEARIVVEKARELLKKFRILFSLAKRSKLYRGYKPTLHDLILTVNDFEEYIQDFKFRHDKEAQTEIDELLRGFTLVV